MPELPLRDPRARRPPTSRSARATSTCSCADTTESTVRVEGTDADDVVVEQRGDSIRVVEPRRGGLFGDDSLRVDVVVPTGQQPGGHAPAAPTSSVRAAPARPAAQRLGDVRSTSSTGTCSSRPAPATIRVDDVAGDLRGQERLGRRRDRRGRRRPSVSTGSGDVSVDDRPRHHGRQDRQRRPEVGDGARRHLVDHRQRRPLDRPVHRGRVTVKGASGDVTIGVPPGVPVWTDITTVTGTIRSNLQGAGQPAGGPGPRRGPRQDRQRRHRPHRGLSSTPPAPPPQRGQADCRWSPQDSEHQDEGARP